MFFPRIMRKSAYAIFVIGLFLALGQPGHAATADVYGISGIQCLEANREKGMVALQVPIVGCDQEAEGSGSICCSSDKVYTIGVIDAPNYVVVVFRFAIIFTAIFLVVLLMISGVMYLASGGSPDYVNKAKGLAKNASISLLLLLFSVVILNQINPALTTLEIAQIDTIESIKCCEIGGTPGTTAAPASTTTATPPPTSPTTLSTTPASTPAGSNTIVARYPDGKCYQYNDTTGEAFKIEVACPGESGGPAGYASPVTAPTSKPIGTATYEYQIPDPANPGKYICPPGGKPLESEKMCLAANAETEEEVGAPLTDPSQLGTIVGDNIVVSASDPRTLKDNIPLIQSAAAAVKTQNIQFWVTSAYRSLVKQQELIAANCPAGATSSTQCNPPTALKGSAHNSGKAVDVWGAQNGVQCISQAVCKRNIQACANNPCQKAVIMAMKAQGFCVLSIEPWHFEKPKVSGSCN